MEGNVRQEGGRAPKKCHPHCPGQVDIIFWGGGGNFSFSLAQWARDQASHLPTKSLKQQTKTCPGQAKFESYLSKGKLEFKLFSHLRRFYSFFHRDIQCLQPGKIFQLSAWYQK